MGTGQKRNTLVNPLAAQAMEKFKYEVAQELGLSIPQDGYWGNYTTRDTIHRRPHGEKDGGSL